MNFDACEKREKMLALCEKLLVIERERLNGACYYTIEELDNELTNAIKAAQEI